MNTISPIKWFERYLRWSWLLITLVMLTSGIGSVVYTSLMLLRFSEILSSSTRTALRVLLGFLALYLLALLWFLTRIFTPSIGRPSSNRCCTGGCVSVSSWVIVFLVGTIMWLAAQNINKIYAPCDSAGSQLETFCKVFSVYKAFATSTILAPCAYVGAVVTFFFFCTIAENFILPRIRATWMFGDPECPLHQA
ncbi:hypothetical protein CC2G_004438 [Coprinopsis cinerea AmutBmut pab1-1]|nr:hypothetical protein CC2G_004438 [Coprinopsis cinerea AmutBmut pab1-1]